MSVNSKKIKYLKTILETEDFYPFLCAFSNNDIEKTIDNLAKLINYILTNDEELRNKSIKELLTEALSYQKQGEFFIFSTNSYLDNIFALTGLNLDARRKGMMSELTKLDQNLSFLTYDKSSYFPIYGSIRKAIEEGFKHPKSLYTSILKQPANKIKPITVGETETKYYNSILQERLQNLPKEYAKTGTKVANKVLNEIIGRDITLYFLPTDKEYEDELTFSILPIHLRKISIPSRYTLLNICAKNKGLHPGEKISIVDGKPYKEPMPKPKKAYSSLRYIRYEKVPIDDTFTYENNELTGDLSYDLDLLYGKLDNDKNVRGTLSSSSLNQNIERIHNSNDINLNLRNGIYDIKNGRHRLLYLKNFFLSNYKSYSNPILLNRLKEMVTIIAAVNRTCEDEEINYYLINLERMFPFIRFIKNDIQNDDFSIIIILGNNSYLIENKQELIEFYNLASKEKFDNEFFFGFNYRYEYISGPVLIAKVITEVKEQFTKMDLADIIYYLRSKPIILRNEQIDISKLNIEMLYNAYTMVIHLIELGELRNNPFDYVAKSEEIIYEYENKKDVRKRR